MTPSDFIYLSILTPLIVFLITPLLKRFTLQRDLLGPIGGVISFFASINITNLVLDGKEVKLTLINISDGLSISFNVYPLGAIFGLVASGLWILASIYSIGYMRGNKELNQTRFFSFYAISIFAALCIAYSGNLLTLFIFYEILTFSTYPLVAHKQNDLSKKSGRLYMGILVGTSVVFLLPAIVIVWVTTGTLDFAKNGILDGQLEEKYIPFLLFLFAFGIGKAALMPFHKWLPAAMVAPTPVSALLHAVAVVKAGVFSILVVIVNVFGIDFLSKTQSTFWLICLACFTLLLSSIIAIYKDDLKARLAYSTISQLSYVVLGAALVSNLAVQGASLHIVMHAVGKITLFFVAGAIYVSAHLSKISELDGQGKSMPLLFFAFFVGSLSIIGVPPMGGSWSKFYLMIGAVESDYIFVLVVLCISTLLNVYYLLEIPARAFFKDKIKEVKVENYPLMTIPTLFAAILTVIIFFYIEPIKNLTNLITSS
tara:strand:+ start:2551 stop:4002 length:1452 start_codon:yes stop_codon:yes gene_type:complete